MGYHERVVPLVDWTGKANGSIKFGQVATLWGIMNLSLHLFQLFSPLKLEVFLSFFQHQ
jgi:hypothetical protein